MYIYKISFPLPQITDTFYPLIMFIVIAFRFISVLYRHNFNHSSVGDFKEIHICIYIYIYIWRHIYLFFFFTLDLVPYTSKKYLEAFCI